MRKIWLFIMILFVSALFLGACKKNEVTEQYTESITPVTPDLTTQINASVNGFITDETGAAVQGATVKGGTIAVTTDQFGYFKINTAAFAKSAGFVQITKAGYFTGYRTFLPTEGKETFIRLQLIPKTITGNINAATGGTVTTTDGAKVTLPANAVVNAATNAAYTGTVNVAIHWLNPTEENKTQLTMPGNLTGVDSSGYLNVLVTYGMLAVELTGSTGQLLQIAPNKKASLNFPIPGAIAATAPASIPLWYFDETKGLWKQDGNAVKNGNNYEGDVSHFSYWNCDYPGRTVRFTAQLVDEALHPLSHVPVAIEYVGGVGSYIVYSNTDGIINYGIPSNSNLVMYVYTDCNSIAYTQNFTSNNTDIDLGTKIIILQQNTATFKGIMNKCNGSPVTDGYVIISGLGYNHVINIENGMFNSTGSICPNSTGAVIAFDREATEQSTPVDITITTGLNDLGVLTACSPVAEENLTYILDGVTTTLTLSQYMFTGNYSFTTDTTEISAFDLLNNSSAFRIYFKGPALSGVYSLVNGNAGNYTSNSGLFFFPNPTTVTITRYGLIGNFIDGNFNGNIQTNTGTHTLTCIFHIKRDT